MDKYQLITTVPVFDIGVAIIVVLLIRSAGDPYSNYSCGSTLRYPYRIWTISKVNQKEKRYDQYCVIALLFFYQIIFCEFFVKTFYPEFSP
ncbi:MAG: hypothetical protein KBA50_09665, partial [Sedimentibacter sp.]|nr:hypothetical protein [Sedimentibacter sp.]